MALGQILGGVGAVGSLLGGLSANKASKENMRRQTQLLNMQNQNFRAAQPYFGQALQQAANYAGLGADGVQQTADNRFRLGGGWGNEQDQLRLQQAEEDIARRQMMNANRLRFQLGRAGIAEGSQASALARNAQLGQQEFGQFRRGLAIDQGREQERRMQALQNLIAQGFGQGSQAAAGYGQQAANYGQQAGGMFGNVGSILQQMEYQKMLRQLGVEEDRRSNNYSGGLGGIR